MYLFLFFSPPCRSHWTILLNVSFVDLHLLWVQTVPTSPKWEITTSPNILKKKVMIFWSKTRISIHHTRVTSRTVIILQKASETKLNFWDIMQEIMECWKVFMERNRKRWVKNLQKSEIASKVKIKGFLWFFLMEWHWRGLQRKKPNSKTLISAFEVPIIVKPLAHTLFTAFFSIFRNFSL